MFIPPTPSDSLSDSNCTHLLLASKTCNIFPDYTIQQIIDQLEHVQYFIDNKTQKILLLHLIPQLNLSLSFHLLFSPPEKIKKSTGTLVLWFLVLIGGFLSTAWRAAFMFPLQNNSQGLHSFIFSNKPRDHAIKLKGIELLVLFKLASFLWWESLIGENGAIY